MAKNDSTTLSISTFLDLIRWISALLVVIGHLRSLIFVDYSEIENKSFILDFFYFLTSLGHESVIVFFVLSGYLVGGSAWKTISNNKFLWSQYLVKRFTRLYIVFIPALVAGYFLDLSGLYFFNDNYIYNNAFEIASLNYDVESRINITTFLLNLLMLQGSISTQFGSNGPLWSLAYEFWYYIIFPILVIIVKKRCAFSEKIFYLIFLSIILYIIDIKILMYFPIWLAGFIAFTNIKYKMKTKYSILILMLMLMLIKLNVITPISDYALALSLATLLISLKHYRLNVKIKNIAINKTLADFSYSLYLSHYPLLLLATSFFLWEFKIGVNEQPGILSFSLFFAFLITSYLYALFFYFLFERKTEKTRIFLMQFVKKINKSRV